MTAPAAKSKRVRGGALMRAVLKMSGLLYRPMTDRPTLSAFQAALDRTLRLSQYVARVARARPAVIEELARREAAPFKREEMRDALADPAGGPMASRLRELRARVMVT